MEGAKKEKIQNRKPEEIIWIHTPKCRECAKYNAMLKRCRLEVCRYPSKR